MEKWTEVQILYRASHRLVDLDEGDVEVALPAAIVAMVHAGITESGEVVGGVVLLLDHPGVAHRTMELAYLLERPNPAHV